MTHRRTLTCMSERTNDDGATLLTKKQAADELGVTTRTVDRYIHDELISTVRLQVPRRAVRISRSEIDRLLAGTSAA